MGVLALFSSLVDTAASTTRSKKRKQFQTVDMRVRMDCEGCERKVRNSVISMKGVQNVEVDRKQHKLSVMGYVDEKKVLKRVRRRTGKKVELWPFKPFYLATTPYAAGAYHKKNPAGYVRDTERHMPDPQHTHEAYTSLFSDDNPHACSIM